MANPSGETSRPGAAIFAVLFLLGTLLLASQLGHETKFSAKAWGTSKLFAQPAFWPGVGVGGMAFFGAMHLIGTWRQRPGWDRREALYWLRPVEYLTWFMVYVFAVPAMGYLPSSVIFAVAVALRTGYRSARTLGAAALVGLGVVLIFKTALSVNIPGGAIYDHLPADLRNFAIVNF